MLLSDKNDMELLTVTSTSRDARFAEFEPLTINVFYLGCDGAVVQRDSSFFN